MAEETATKLPLSTLLLVEELWGGDALVAPVADLSLASSGDEGEALLEQEVFLAEYLAQAPPPVIAKFPLPAGTALRTVTVLIPREELPQRLAIRSSIAVPCLVIPAVEASWVVVLPLRHTIYLDEGEDLAEAVRGEVLRLLSAEEPSPVDYLRLLPSRTQRLEPLSVAVERPDRMPPARAASLRKALVERQKRQRAAEVLGSIARRWQADESLDEACPVEGREAELKLLGALLGSDERSSVVLVGPEASGKTALLRAWFEQEHLQGRSRSIYQTSGAQLIAGMSGLGQWQERIRRVFEAAEDLDAVLYFDNLADLFAERVEGSIDMAGAMKPYLEQGRVRVVGELTSEQLELAEARQSGFLACLSRLKVGPLGALATARGLRVRVAYDRRRTPDKATLAEGAVNALVDLAERYLPYQAFPGKAFRLYDELRAVHSEALSTRDGRAPELTAEHLYEHFSLSSGVPAFLLRDDRTLRVGDVVAFLRKHLIGQHEAVQRVAEAVCVVKAGLQPTGKPLATFLFVGPTGVGKTELARALASYLFGSPERMLRFDMSEYMDGEAAERLIRGTDRADGLLTRRVREQPFCVLLLDEIEKASRGVFDLLLQVCGEGRLTDARGKTAYFHNAIIIMTSNLGAAHHRASAGFGGALSEDEAYYQRQVNASFRPEFVNRLDRIIAFRALSASEGERVTRLSLEKVCSRRGLLEGGVTLAVSQRALAMLSRGGYSERYGARALRRYLEDHLVAPVARLLSSLGAAGREVTVRVLSPDEPEADASERSAGLTEGSLRFEVLTRRASPRDDEQAGAQRVAALRREAAQLQAMPRVEQVREQIAYLTAQLSYGKRTERDRRASQDVSELQADLHRLSECYQALASALHHLETTEELTLMALFDGDPLGDLQAEAELAGQQACEAAVRALLALEPRRDAITLRVQETSGEGALFWWLVALGPLLRARGWEATFHLQDDARPYAGYWPRTMRRWGPPRSLDEVIGFCHDKDTSKHPRSALVSVRGSYAGVLLALEAGAHRWVGVPNQEKITLTVQRIVLRASLADREWALPQLAPLTPAQLEEERRAKPQREFDLKAGTLTVHDQVYDAEPATYEAVFARVALDLLRRYERATAPDRDPLFASALEASPDDEEPTP